MVEGFNGLSSSSISFEQPSELLEPIFKLPKMQSASEQAIDAINKAIQRVLANASHRQLIIDQPLVHTLVQFLTSLFDPTMARCWAIRVMKGKSTIDLLINFLFDDSNMVREIVNNFVQPAFSPIKVPSASGSKSFTKYWPGKH